MLRSPRRPAGKSRDIRCGEASFVERCVAARITPTHSAVEHKLELSQLRCTNPPYAQRGGLGQLLRSYSTATSQLLHSYFTVTSQLLHENHQLKRGSRWKIQKLDKTY